MTSTGIVIGLTNVFLQSLELAFGVLRRTGVGCSGVMSDSERSSDDGVVDCSSGGIRHGSEGVCEEGL